MTRPAIERRSPVIPRELPRTGPPCQSCGSDGPVLNGLFFKNLRELAGLTQTEMARLCGVSKSALSRMENGELPFPPRVAWMYERLFERRRKAGELRD